MTGAATHSAYCCFSLFSCSGTLWRQPPRLRLYARRKIQINTTQSACQATCETISALLSPLYLYVYEVYLLVRGLLVLPLSPDD